MKETAALRNYRTDTCGSTRRDLLERRHPDEEGATTLEQTPENRMAPEVTTNQALRRTPRAWAIPCRR
jgi:hypothetical protein